MNKYAATSRKSTDKREQKYMKLNKFMEQKLVNK